MPSLEEAATDLWRRITPPPYADDRLGAERDIVAPMTAEEFARAFAPTVSIGPPPATSEGYPPGHIWIQMPNGWVPEINAPPPRVEAAEARTTLHLRNGVYQGRVVFVAQEAQTIYGAEVVSPETGDVLTRMTFPNSTHLVAGDAFQVTLSLVDHAGPTAPELPVIVRPILT